MGTVSLCQRLRLQSTAGLRAVLLLILVLFVLFGPFRQSSSSARVVNDSEAPRAAKPPSAIARELPDDDVDRLPPTTVGATRRPTIPHPTFAWVPKPEDTADEFAANDAVARFNERIDETLLREDASADLPYVYPVEEPACVEEMSNVMQYNTTASFESTLAARARPRPRIPTESPLAKSTRRRLGRGANPHMLIRDAARRVSAQLNCRRSRSTPFRYTILGMPHFAEGRRLFERSLLARGWTYVPWGKRGFPQAQMLLASCFLLAGSSRWQDDRLPPIVSSWGPLERFSIKPEVILASVQEYFSKKPECDYRHLFPETVFPRDDAACAELEEMAVNPTAEVRKTIWIVRHLSDNTLRFGTIRQVVSVLSRAGGCKNPPQPPTFLIQRGILGVLRHAESGKLIQGRSFLLITGRRVFFFAGYVGLSHSVWGKIPSAINLNALSEVPESSTENSDFLSVNQFSEYLRTAFGATSEDVTRLRDQVKIAANHVYLALRDSTSKSFQALPKKASGASFALLSMNHVVVKHPQDGKFSVRVLDIHCNCELFALEHKWGEARARASTSLVPDLLDLVFASNPRSLNGDADSDREFVEALETNLNELRDPRSSIEMDHSIDGLPHRPRTWELIHSDVHPKFSLIKAEKDC